MVLPDDHFYRPRRIFAVRLEDCRVGTDN